GSGPGFRRPVVVVQSNPFNQSRVATVVVAVITSNLALADAPEMSASGRRTLAWPGAPSSIYRGYTRWIARCSPNEYAVFLQRPSAPSTRVRGWSLGFAVARRSQHETQARRRNHSHPCPPILAKRHLSLIGPTRTRTAAVAQHQ